MATTTTNLGLTKPATTDAVDISVINGNMDLIDAALGVSTVTVTAATSNVTIASQSVKQYGKIIIGSVRFTLSSAVSAYANLINTAKAPATDMKFPVYDNAGNLVASKAIYMDYNNTNLRAASSLAAGTYNVSFTYLVV